MHIPTFAASDSALKRQLSRLASFVLRGGPLPDEYDEISYIFDEIAAVRVKSDSSLLRGFAEESGGAFNSLETNQGFVCLCPHGYYGDFEIIDRVYTEWVSDNSHLQNWDRYFQSSTASRAVRARKGYLHNTVTSAATGSTSLSVLNVASGPGRDLQELLGVNPLLAAKMRVHCIDQDAKALAYAENLLKDFSERVTFEQANVLKWRSEDKYDLVWSAGLFDYLSDGLFARVLRKLILNCKKGGQVVIGNFSHRNVHRTYMEFGGWHLRHRSEAELVGLAKLADVEESRIHVGEEESGVNLFLHVSC